MARPCGCGDSCNCVIRSGHGTDVTGSGTTASPYIIDFDGADVVDQGLTWNPSTRMMSTKLAFGGGLEFDSQGAMRTTGSGPDPSGPIDLIAPLENPERRGDVFCGFMGAGNLIKPESFLRSYDFGLGSGVDMMHAAVRYLRDATPVVCWDERLGRTAYHPADLDRNWWMARLVEQQSPHFWNVIPHPAGMEDGMVAWQPHLFQDPLLPGSWEPSRPHPYAPAAGWFGYLERPQWGGTFLADIMRICYTKTPLVLHLNFPSTIQDPMASPPWRSYLFLLQIRRLLQLYRMQYQVVIIVNDNQLTIPQASGDVPTDVLAYFRDTARIGPNLTTAEAVAAHPPESFADKGWTWCVLPPFIDPAQIKAYSDAGIHVLVAPVNRQYLWESVVKPAEAKGVISGDPFYYAGALQGQTQHLLASRGYRDAIGRYDDRTILHGLLNPFDDDPARQQPLLRGALHVEPIDDSQRQMYLGPEMVGQPDGRSYWVLQGYLCPHPSEAAAENWSMDFSWQFDGQWSGQTTDRMALAFCVPTDHKFADWDQPPQNRPLDNGYALYMGQDSWCHLVAFTEGAEQAVMPFRLITDTRPGRDGRKRFKICVDPRGVRICAIMPDGGWNELATSNDPVYVDYRGNYTFFGRLSRDRLAWTGRVLDVEMHWGQGTEHWNQARPRP